MQLGFSQQNWKERKAYLGHTSENAFEVFCKKEGITFEHFGFKSESLLDYKTIPVYVRTRPDYICQKENENFFVEVNGVGKDGIIKIKIDAVVGIPFWEMLLPVKIFIYDSTRKKYSLFPFSMLKRKVTMNDPQRFESDRKIYFPIGVNEFTWGKV
jgi:hypothetical protein